MISVEAVSEAEVTWNGQRVTLGFDDENDEVSISLPGGSTMQILPRCVLGASCGPVPLFGVIVHRLAQLGQA